MRICVCAFACWLVTLVPTVAVCVPVDEPPCALCACVCHVLPGPYPLGHDHYSCVPGAVQPVQGTHAVSARILGCGVCVCFPPAPCVSFVFVLPPSPTHGPCVCFLWLALASRLQTLDAARLMKCIVKTYWSATQYSLGTVLCQPEVRGCTHSLLHLRLSPLSSILCVHLAP